ncbi:MAG: GNAT family N-acetyltransferase [Kofleriaceae bacterium]
MAWSSAELLREALVVPRGAYLKLPDLEVIERPGWMQIITPSVRDGGLNEVALAVLDPAEADAVIDATLERYRGIKFRWTVGPDSAPADLGARLARRGLVHSISHAMTRTTAGEVTAPPPEITIDRVDHATVDAFSRVMAEGWASDLARVAAINDLVLRSHPQHHLYLARIAGEPAASAVQVRFARSTYLLGAVVLPRFRRRGLYRALVDARLADARAAGLDLATSHALAATSAPLLARMGFETACTLDVYSG